jgi:anaerobic carbon-monoxide dehydrogenase iron sulfur subunit
MVGIVVNPERCCGCRICEMACSMDHLGIFNPRRASLRVNINRDPDLGTKPSQIDVPVVCLQCDPAPCAEACPEGAIEKGAYGAWLVDEERCIGCGLCVDACPHGMVVVDTQGQRVSARKCNLCQGDPSCVKYCPTEALTFKNGGGL